MVNHNSPNNIQMCSTNLVVFTASGSYTKPANLVAVIIECVGAGGGGGGAASAGGGTSNGGGGGGAGEYSRVALNASSLSASETITIGAAGGGGAAGNNAGSAGGTTSCGALCSANGGGGGAGAASGATSGVGAAGGSGGTGTFSVPGMAGNYGVRLLNASYVIYPKGGADSKFGYGGNCVVGFPGPAATGYGAGGGGGSSYLSGTQAGGNGSAGIAIITEYLGST